MPPPKNSTCSTHTRRFSNRPARHGEIYRWFVTEYAPKHPRSCMFRDLCPEVAIVRFPDSYWGQLASGFPKNLYGGADMPAPASVAWIDIWRLLTHGQTSKEGLSFFNRGWPKRHDFFYPLNGVVVYDHLVSGDRLKGLRLLFLTGLKVSEDTLAAVVRLVRDDGLVCVSLRSLAPESIVNMAGADNVVTDGKGRWVLTDDFKSGHVSKAVEPYLGRPDEIRYLFKDRVLTVRRGDDNNDIRVYMDERGVTEPENRVW